MNEKLVAKAKEYIEWRLETFGIADGDKDNEAVKLANFHEWMINKEKENE